MTDEQTYPQLLDVTIRPIAVPLPDAMVLRDLIGVVEDRSVREIMAISRLDEMILIANGAGERKEALKGDAETVCRGCDMLLGYELPVGSYHDVTHDDVVRIGEILRLDEVGDEPGPYHEMCCPLCWTVDQDVRGHRHGG